ncbi:MAG: ribosome biogenesis GTPase YlqF [Gloeomargaritaceae cyanobacterium C42_A2020_066]|nr:ribosome biogenesis GTPase YlqF [Gloeomargaritaceae cyanobacterium C42_A2020_066]
MSQPVTGRTGQVPALQWYPGHMAQGLRAFREQLPRIDMVLTVLDARIPQASYHPLWQVWLGERPQVILLNRIDQVSPAVGQAWCQWWRASGWQTFPTNGQTGQGVAQVVRAAQQLGAAINRHRQGRGLKPRAVRLAVVGCPNVGKSALINRLLGRRVATSAPRPGVTRQVRWVRLGTDLDLMDTPGLLPPRLEDQDAALKLAICDDIGAAVYDAPRIATHLVDYLTVLEPLVLERRYGLRPEIEGSEAYLETLGERHHWDSERTAQRLLQDFRQGQLGTLALEYPPTPAAPTPPSGPHTPSPGGVAPPDEAPK